jgi:hypothetical protein
MRLLEVQALDTRLDQLAHRRRSLPELAEISRLESDLARLRDLIVAAETERSDVERERGKAESDVAQVRARADRDQKRLDSGQVGSPRELQNLQSEIVSLQRRQAELEDVELAVMERLEDVEARLTQLVAERDRDSAAHAAAVARRDTAFAEIDEEIAATQTDREKTSAGLGGELVALYEKVRAQSDGIGAAALRQRRCLGCQLELNTTDIGRIRSAPDDEVLRCEECRRILVRTPESGL